MKTNIIKTARRLSLSFSLLIFGVGVINAQLLEKTFVSEIDISEDAKIIIGGPKNFDFEGHGTLSISSEDQKYVIKGKDWKPIAKIDQDFKINTWDGNKVKQVIELKIEATDPKKSQELLKKLQVNLEENVAGQVHINCNLGIKKFVVVNGFFRKDRASIKLEDGSSYDIKRLELKATLFIPKTNDLDLDLRFISTTLGEHTGKVKAKITHAGLNSESLNELDLEAAFATVRLKTLDQLKIKLESSQVSIKDITKIKGSSSFSKYILGTVGTLSLSNSANDKFTIKAVEDINVKSATFTDFQITTLLMKMNINASSGDIIVSTIKKGFESLQLNNQFSTISLGVESTEDYIIEILDNTFTSYDYPSGLKKTNNSGAKNDYLLMGDKTKAGKIKVQCESCKILYDY